MSGLDPTLVIAATAIIAFAVGALVGVTVFRLGLGRRGDTRVGPSGAWGAALVTTAVFGSWLAKQWDVLFLETSVSPAIWFASMATVIGIAIARHAEVELVDLARGVDAEDALETLVPGLGLRLGSSMPKLIATTLRVTLALVLLLVWATALGGSELRAPILLLLNVVTSLASIGLLLVLGGLAVRALKADDLPGARPWLVGGLFTVATLVVFGVMPVLFFLVLGTAVVLGVTGTPRVVSDLIAAVRLRERLSGDDTRTLSFPDGPAQVIEVGPLESRLEHMDGRSETVGNHALWRRLHGSHNAKGSATHPARDDAP